jgi:NDP-sugar pyrophosphorylase family protein
MSGLDIAVAAQRVRDAAFTFLVRGGFHRFGRGSRILLPFRTGGADRISVGRDVLIGASSWLIVPTRDDPGPCIEIYDRVRMNQTSISAVRSVVIEEAVAIARGCYISDHSHGFDDPATPIRDQPVTRIAPVRIETGAWLGQNVVVLPGVTIGAGAVIGANSVVRSDIPPRSVAAGSPARVIRELPA